VDTLELFRRFMIGLYFKSSLTFCQAVFIIIFVIL